MPFYMFQARYTADAIKAMVDNPQDREAAARPLIEAIGGKLHNLFFCFGNGFHIRHCCCNTCLLCAIDRYWGGQCREDGYDNQNNKELV